MYHRIKYTAFIILLTMLVSAFAASSVYAQEKVVVEKISVAEAEKDDEKASAVTKPSDMPWTGSLMFDKEKLSRLYMVLKGYDLPEEEQEEEQSQEEGPKDTVVAPAYYLSSILYYSPESWTVWLNNIRLRKGDNIDKLYVEDVQETEVTLIVGPFDLDVISENWDKRLTPLSPSVAQVIESEGKEVALRWNYVSEDKRVYVDGKKNMIKFTVQLQQTFASRTMSVVDGFVASYIRKIKTDEGTAALNEVLDGLSSSGGGDSSEEPNFDDLVEELFDNPEMLNDSP